MIRKGLAVAAATVLTLVLAAAASSNTHAVPTLTGTVGPGFTITVKVNNKVVKTLKAGSYKLVINDKASIHGFSLDGPHGPVSGLRSMIAEGRPRLRRRLKNRGRGTDRR